MGPMVEEVRRENAKTSRLGGKQKKNGLFRRYLWYSFFWKRDHVFDGFIEYWDPFFFGDPLFLGIPLNPAGLIGIFVVAYYNPHHNWVVQSLIYPKPQFFSFFRW